MNTYAILRRDGWHTPEDLEAAAMRSQQVGDEQMPDDVSWIRSYVLVEKDGSLGTVCIYLATDSDALRRHADAAELPIDEIVAVADTVVIRPDPSVTTAWAASGSITRGDVSHVHDRSGSSCDQSE